MQETQVHILIVVEDELLRELTEFRLTQLGFSVAVERDGRATLRRVEHERPDLLIIGGDIHDMDGIELIDGLRNSLGSEIPIICLSNDASLDAVRKTFTAGADDYVVTPYDPATLESKIDMLLSEHQI